MLVISTSSHQPHKIVTGIVRKKKTAFKLTYPANSAIQKLAKKLAKKFKIEDC